MQSSPPIPPLERAHDSAVLYRGIRIIPAPFQLANSHWLGAGLLVSTHDGDGPETETSFFCERESLSRSTAVSAALAEGRRRVDQMLDLGTRTRRVGQGRDKLPPSLRRVAVLLLASGLWQAWLA